MKIRAREKGVGVAYVLSAAAALSAVTVVAFSLVGSVLKPATNVSYIEATRAALSAGMSAVGKAAGADTDSSPLPPAGLVVSGDGYDIPVSTGAPQVDGWGVKLRYCPWDNGLTSSAGRISGDTAPTSSSILFALVSAGPDKSFSTTCAQVKVGTIGGDDIATWKTIGTYSRDGVGNPWLLDSVDCENASTPTTDVSGAASGCSSSVSRLDLIDTSVLKEGQQLLVRKSGKLVAWQSGVWHQIGGSGTGSYPAPDLFDFADLTEQACGATVESSAVQINGIVTGTPVSIDGGTYAISSDNATYSTWTSSVSSIGPGTWIKLRGTLPSPGSSTIVVNIGGSETTWQASTTTECGGSAVFTTVGSHSWIVPAGVTSISAVCVGGGQGGGGRTDGENGNPGGNAGNGGGAGALAYKNAISVTPGSAISITTGRGGQGGNGSGFEGAESGHASTLGGYFSAGGGNGSLGGSPTGSYTGGFTGGRGSDPVSHNNGGNGGGTAGYTANGGDGAPANSGSGGGGGVGLYGGSSGGQGGQGNGVGGTGGSGGTSGGSGGATGGAGGRYGGGGGGGATSGQGFGGKGGQGACRIVWPGTSRQFPSTNVGIIGTETTY